MRLTMLGVLTALLGALLVAPLSPAPATAGASGRPRDVVSRGVVFDVENTNDTAALCSPDDQSYQLRGRLIGPRRDIDEQGDALRVNVLVHDLGTGSWFWTLPGHASYDYATRLARHGETSLVLDRLGYGRSKLDDGDATCLGAQADMLHQVVQHLRSGRYDFASPVPGVTSTPAAAHVVTQGHAVGAEIAQLEASTFDDVDGLVLMSWAAGGATSLATRTAAAQTRACGSTDYAPLATSGSDYRALLFASAPRGVQQTAARLRPKDPCGDVTSSAAMALATGLGAGQVDAPVLLLYGSKDALTNPRARESQAASYPTEVTTHTFQGAGSALPLEKPRAVRSVVLRWLR
ncbi:alpha/beta hydrolase [Nocardioides sp. CN2-186]|uniref:alpha/beta fold hydrolase n=1 Tax=Nocardioides tweenelious TaxID=3156607 RepID=UPI0032B3B355